MPSPAVVQAVKTVVNQELSRTITDHVAFLVASEEPGAYLPAAIVAVRRSNVSIESIDWAEIWIVNKPHVLLALAKEMHREAVAAKEEEQKVAAKVMAKALWNLYHQTLNPWTRLSDNDAAFKVTMGRRLETEPQCTDGIAMGFLGATSQLRDALVTHLERRRDQTSLERGLSFWDPANDYQSIAVENAIAGLSDGGLTIHPGDDIEAIAQGALEKLLSGWDASTVSLRAQTLLLEQKTKSLTPSDSSSSEESLMPGGATDNRSISSVATGRNSNQ